MPPPSAMCRTRHEMLIGTHRLSMSASAIVRQLKREPATAAYIRVVLLAIGEGATISQFGGLQAATAMVGFKDITAYTASKHAVISLTKAAIL